MGNYSHNITFFYRQSSSKSGFALTSWSTVWFSSRFRWRNNDERENERWETDYGYTVSSIHIHMWNTRRMGAIVNDCATLSVIHHQECQEINNGQINVVTRIRESPRRLRQDDPFADSQKQRYKIYEVYVLHVSASWETRRANLWRRLERVIPSILWERDGSQSNVRIVAIKSRARAPRASSSLFTVD